MRLVVRALLILVLNLSFAGAYAAEISASIRDQNGEPVAGAVISAGTTSTGSASSKTATEIMDQINKEFVPHVKPVLAGTDISFPNKDDIRHHVYSFSDAKQFELPLYEGTPANPIRFDKPGVVVLGCNIHDWMRGYIYVLDTPFFARSDTGGTASIGNIPAGSYTVTVWHPRMKNSGPDVQRSVTLDDAGNASLAFELELKPKSRIRRAPSARRRSGY